MAIASNAAHSSSSALSSSSSSLNFHLNILHLVLVMLRFLSAMFGTGYVHPDEHFQSIQPAFRDAFGGDDAMVKTSTHIPWEFTAKMPVRSSIAHGLMSSVPYRIWMRISPSITSKTWWLLAAPRATMTLYSLIIDFVAIKIAKKKTNSNAFDTCQSYWRRLGRCL